MMVIYAVQANVSIIQVFLAGFLPGLLVMALYSGYIIDLVAAQSEEARRRPSRAMSLREKLRESAQLIPTLLLIVLVFLSLLMGWATATECAAWGVLGSLAIAWWHGMLSWPSFFQSVMGATRVTCMIMLILAGASYMSTSMAYTGVPQALAAWVGGFGLSPYALIAALTVMYIVLGTALDGISMIVLTTAVVIPMIKAGGLRPGLVRHFRRAGGGDGGGVAAGRLQPVRAADHERQGFQHRGAGVAAVLLPAGPGGCHHHGVS